MDHLKALYGAGDYGGAWEYYLGNPQRDTEWHLYGALTAWRLKDPYGGKLAAQVALDNRPKGALRVRCLFVAGVCYREYGEMLVAVERLDECLRLLPNHPVLQPLLTGSVFYNRGLALGSCGQLTEALSSYEAALVEFSREGMDDFARQCLQNLAWIAAEMGRFPRAIEAVDEAEPLCTTEDARLRQQTVRALLLGLTGDGPAAMALCEGVHRAEGAPPDLRSLTASISAEVALRLGLIDLALTMANIAWTYADMPPRDGRCLVRASKILSEAQRAKLGTGA